MHKVSIFQYLNLFVALSDRWMLILLPILHLQSYPTSHTTLEDIITLLNLKTFEACEV